MTNQNGDYFSVYFYYSSFKKYISEDSEELSERAQRLMSITSIDNSQDMFQCRVLEYGFFVDDDLLEFQFLCPKRKLLMVIHYLHINGFGDWHHFEVF
ncbi:hypothetical protein FACS189472_06990 [Alphaproteobacteria bacterium]|nr:hypothetical protein FACS189472_06990 [Alphaproteobacteria bacterium]